MKTILVTDSEMIIKRIIDIITGISGLEISASVKSIQEAYVLVKKLNPELLIISLQRINKLTLDTLREIKLFNKSLNVIVLTASSSVEYINAWEKEGADYVFDQAMQLNPMVDVLCDLLYKKHLDSMIADKTFNNNQ